MHALCFDIVQTLLYPLSFLRDASQRKCGAVLHVVAACITFLNDADATSTTVVIVVAISGGGADSVVYVTGVSVRSSRQFATTWMVEGAANLYLFATGQGGSGRERESESGTGFRMYLDEVSGLALPRQGGWSVNFLGYRREACQVSVT